MSLVLLNLKRSDFLKLIDCLDELIDSTHKMQEAVDVSFLQGKLIQQAERQGIEVEQEKTNEQKS